MASGIDTVIFDMDGVIFDSEILVLQAWNETAADSAEKNFIES